MPAATKIRAPKQKSALPFKRRSGYLVPPEALHLEKDPNKKHYDPRVHYPYDEEWVDKIISHGVQIPVLVEKVGELVVVLDGRQRVINSVEANRRLVAAGLQPIMIPASVKRGDAKFLFEVSVITNIHRRQEDPITQAFKAQRYKNMGHTEKDAARLWRVTDRTIRNWIYLLDLCEEVQKAVAEGRITTSAAIRLRNMSDEDQIKALNAPAPDKPKARRPSQKKVLKVLGVDRLPRQVRAAIQWATGAITDDEAADQIKSLGSALEAQKDDPNQARLFK